MIDTLIVEDVPLARDALVRLLAQHADVRVIGAAGTVAEARQLIEQHRPHLIFLDMALPDGTGLSLAEAILPPRPAIIFLTAFPDFALPAFGVEALDYLLKPGTPEDVARALDRVRRAMNAAAPSAPNPFLEIRDGGRTSFVPLDSIERVDAAGHYLCVHAAGEVHLLRTPITELIARLGPDFVRVHRSTLVRLDRIVSITDRRNSDGDITLLDGSVVPLSRTFRSDLTRQLALRAR
ncbi:two-component system LytT family response regulator [Sphingomonas sp. SORGH_AS 950]|uniref:LytR/AlgR family response regulator transcription factor n=1 Tax=unclassified Sphingomonas TaxID=196159 RepID=UPI0027878751|nr:MULTISPECIES: LytTR family DNA-binding domain-containing protein [unclassified Sphingomonas]MDQ1159018.1 two-component system LytT family response regulator [Sphingomonas sp. SORGH_AS_0950]MDR6146182.1 two-component system LytT family response regulator [Sphingomonas sp. SORGH_AS_0870]